MGCPREAGPALHTGLSPPPPPRSQPPQKGFLHPQLGPAPRDANAAGWKLSLEKHCVRAIDLLV